VHRDRSGGFGKSRYNRHSIPKHLALIMSLYRLRYPGPSHCSTLVKKESSCTSVQAHLHDFPLGQISFSALLVFPVIIV
jgi:hypothetical protein